MTKRETISPTPLEDAARLKTLFKEKSQLSQAEFGSRYEIGSQGMVWQYLNGSRPLNISAASKFAKGLGVAIDDFSPSIAEIINQASHHIAEAHAWPFDNIDETKFRSLDKAAAARIEGAVLVLASQIDVDLKKQ